MSICKKCILPDYYPGIKMDEEGVCNFCRDHVHIEKLKEELESKSYELDGIISDARKNRIASNGVYDAIVPISGGKDSAYVAYVLKKKYNLNILAITYDNGFLSGYAKDNVWNIANKLDIDLVVLKPKWSLMKKLFASMMRETNEFCNVCNSMGYLLVASYVMRMAKVWKHIPLTVLGWVKRYEAQPGIQSFTIAEFLKIMEKQGVIDELYNDSMMDKDVIDKFLKIGDPRKVSISEYKEKAGYNVLQLAEYIDWDIDKVVSTLKKELDWIVPENSIRSTHFDCDAAEIKEYLKYKKHKITQRTIISSHLIRDDRLSREDALEILNNENHEKPEFWDEFVRRLQIEDVQI